MINDSDLKTSMFRGHQLEIWVHHIPSGLLAHRTSDYPLDEGEASAYCRQWWMREECIIELQRRLEAEHRWAQAALIYA